MGEGIETRLQSLAEGTRSRLRRLRMARRLRNVFGEPIESRTGEAIHRRTGGDHRKIGFQEELRALLRKHEMEWDEKYIWD